MKLDNDVAGTRSYHQQARAMSAAETEARIRAAAMAAFAAQRFDQVTLDDIARRAQVRVPTILRHFVTKEQLFVLVTQHMMLTSQREREVATASSLREVAALVVQHFEQRGSLILHFLQQAANVPAIRAVTEEGQRYHRQWIAALIAPLLPPLSETERERLLVQISALTDVQFWQTLRHALNQTCTATEQAMLALMEGAIMVAQQADA